MPQKHASPDLKYSRAALATGRFTGLGIAKLCTNFPYSFIFCDVFSGNLDGSLQ